MRIRALRCSAGLLLFPVLCCPCAVASESAPFPSSSSESTSLAASGFEEADRALLLPADASPAEPPPAGTTPDPGSLPALRASGKAPVTPTGSFFGNGNPGLSWLDAPLPDAGNPSSPQAAISNFEAPLPSQPILEQTLEAPSPAAPAGAPVQFPFQSMESRPLGNLAAPSFIAARRTFRIGSARVRYGAEISSAIGSTDNVFGSPTNPQSDLFFSLQPAFVVEAGTKNSVRVMYSPSILRYARFKQFDTVNQTFLFSSRLRITKLQLGLDAGYLTQSGLFLSSDGQAKQETLFARFFANYPVTRKIDFLAELNTNFQNNEPGGRQNQVIFTAGLEYRYSRKTALGTSLTLGLYSLPGGEIRYQEFLMRIRYAPTAKIVVTADGGIQLRQSTDGTGKSYGTSTTVFNIRLAYQLSRKTSLAIRFFRNVSADAFVADALQTVTGIEGRANWRISPQVSLDAALLSGFAENSSLEGVTGESYSFNQATASLAYFPRPGINIQLFTTFQQRYRDSLQNNYNSSTSGMLLGLGF